MLVLILILPTAALFPLALFCNTLPGDDALLSALRVDHDPWRSFLA